MLIRKATEQDIQEIHSLAKYTEELKSANQKIPYTKSELKHWLKEPEHNILLIAEENNKFIGFLYAKIMSNKWCTIDSIVIKPEHRGKNKGEQLLKHLYNLLEKKEIYYISAIVGEEFEKAREFWKNQNFKEKRKLIWIDRFIE